MYHHSQGGKIFQCSWRIRNAYTASQGTGRMREGIVRIKSPLIVLQIEPFHIECTKIVLISNIGRVYKPLVYHIEKIVFLKPLS